VSIAQAQGIQIQDYPTIEISGRLQGTLDEAVQYVISQGAMMEQHGGKSYRQGMLLDIERNRRTEIEDTGGFLVRHALNMGIQAPYLETGYRIIRALEQTMP
jgi:ketopantoate reductase